MIVALIHNFDYNDCMYVKYMQILICSIRQVLYFGLGTAWRRQMAKKERQIRKDTSRWEVILLFFDVPDFLCLL
jgi:hypothetical protein